MSTFPRSRLPVFALVASLVAVCAFPSAAASEPRPEPRLIGPRETLTTGERAVRFAVAEVGVPYRWGGESPATGFDCSGLVRYAYGRVGIDLPHNSYALYGEGRRIPASRMAPGDILFFEGLGHVGLYLGHGRMVHAPETGRNVEVVPLSATSYGARLVGARRVGVA
jgi:cell wall-associated NlpC family hydrolase